MQRYFEYYMLGKEERRIGTALGILSALFALLVVGGVFVVQQSVESYRADQFQEEQNIIVQENQVGRTVASQW